MKINLNLLRLKAARTNKGLTQAELGEAIGKSSWTIVRLESGERQPKEEELSKIAAALNVSTSYLLGLSDSVDIAIQDTVSSEPIFSNSNPLLDTAAIFDMVKTIFMRKYVVPVLSRNYLENIKGVIPPQKQLLSYAQNKELINKSNFTEVSVETPPFALELDFNANGIGISYYIGDILVFNPLEDTSSLLRRGENPVLLVFYNGNIYLCYMDGHCLNPSQYFVLGCGDNAPDVRVIIPKSTDEFRVLGVYVALIRERFVTHHSDIRVAK